MKQKKQATGYGLGTVVFDTKKRKGITPGQWKKEDGPALKGSVRWWNFLEAEEERRPKVGKKLEYRYDERRRRIKSEGVSDKRTKSGKDQRDVPILPYPGRVPRVNRPRNVRSTK